MLDTIFGDRTNALTIYVANAKYIDFTYLYPWVNKYCLYPIRHPIIITENFDEYISILASSNVEWYLPILPYWCNENLMFALCWCCAESLNQYPCQHTEEERGITSNWLTEEVKLAAQKSSQISYNYT